MSKVRKPKILFSISCFHSPLLASLEILIQLQLLPLHGQLPDVAHFPLTLAERVTWLRTPFFSEVISQWGASSLCHSFSPPCHHITYMVSFYAGTFSFTLILAVFQWFCRTDVLIWVPIFLLTYFHKRLPCYFLSLSMPLWGAGGEGREKDSF